MHNFILSWQLVATDRRMDRVLFDVEEASDTAEVPSENRPLTASAPLRSGIRRRIFVHSLDGKRVPLDLEENDGIEMVQMKIAEKDPLIAFTNPDVKQRKLLDERGDEVKEGSVEGQLLVAGTTLTLILERYTSYHFHRVFSIKAFLYCRYPTYADWLGYKTRLPRFVFVLVAAIIGNNPLLLKIFASPVIQSAHSVIWLFLYIGSLLIAACAQIAFNLPWSDAVPVSFQTFGVLFFSAVLGITLAHSPSLLNSIVLAH